MTQLKGGAMRTRLPKKGFGWVSGITGLALLLLGGVDTLQWMQVSRAAQKGRERAGRVQAHP